MNTASRAFGGESDLQLLKDFVTAVTAHGTYHSYWHVGDLLWGMYQNTIFDPQQNIRLWENEVGELLGFAWLDWREVTIQASPRLEGNDLNDLLEHMLVWGEECQRASLKGRDAGGSLGACALTDDFSLIELLKHHEFQIDWFHVLHMHRDLNQPIAQATLPEGWSIRPVAGEGEFQERVALHREAWHPSKVTLEAYRRMRGAPGYTPELDLVTVAPDGPFASYCICWLDSVNNIGLFEPVGTRLPLECRD